MGSGFMKPEVKTSTIHRLKGGSEKFEKTVAVLS
jgi:hypothetical protein